MKISTRLQSNIVFKVLDELFYYTQETMEVTMEKYCRL